MVEMLVIVKMVKLLVMMTIVALLVIVKIMNMLVMIMMMMGPIYAVHLKLSDVRHNQLLWIVMIKPVKDC